MSLKDLLRAAGKPEYSVVKALDRFLVTRSALPSKRERGVWHPSEIVSDDFCPRFEVLRRRLGIRSPRGELDVGLERIFDVGHAVHYWYQEHYLGPMGILWGNWRCSRCLTVVQGVMPKDSCEICQWGDSEDKEMADLTPPDCVDACEGREPGREDERGRWPESVKARGGCVHCGKWGHWEFVEMVVKIPDHNILGRTDGLLLDERERPEIVTDVKTCNERRFGGVLGAGPSEQNKKQVNLYMHGLGKKRGCILYISKNDGRIAEFFFDYDAKVIERELNDTKLLEKCLADPDEDLPPRHRGCRSSGSVRAASCPACDPCFEV